MPNQTTPRLLLVTGLSGAGKSEVLRALEDSGFSCIDNLPLRLLPTLISEPDQLPEQLVIGVDARTLDLADHQPELIEALQNDEHNLKPELIFLTADHEVIERRYNITRRPHPAAFGRPLADSIELEAEMLAPLQAAADVVVDTSAFKAKDLWRWVQERYQSPAEAAGGLQVVLFSFGFKNGAPRSTDFMFDVRHLQNPYYLPELKPLTGRDKEIIKYIASDETYAPFYEHLKGLLLTQLSSWQAQDRSYVTIAIGCTGGQHRSVMVTEQLTKDLADAGFNIIARHRELNQAAGA